MKKLFVLFLLLSCQVAVADFWTQKASLGIGRRMPFCFSIGNKGYIGTGGTQDFWEYDRTTNAWTQKANFSAGYTLLGTGFSLLGKGYAGLGYDSSGFSNNFWEYDTTLNVWTQKANFGGAVRAGSSGFSSDSLGYIGFGYNTLGPITFFNDLWEYHPITDTWVQKASCPGSTRQNASAFTIGSKAYVAIGSSAATYLSDFWEYDMINDIWTQKANFPGYARTDAVGFSIGNYGYLGTGEEQPLCCNFTKTFFQYNVALNQWIQKATFPGVARDEGGGFAIGNRGYIGFGGTNGSPLYHDFWEYTPDSTTNVQELNQNKFSVIISPNPFSDKIEITIESSLPTIVILYDITSRKMLQKEFINSVLLSTEQLAKGTYLYEVRNKNGLHKKGKVVKD